MVEICTRCASFSTIGACILSTGKSQPEGGTCGVMIFRLVWSITKCVIDSKSLMKVTRSSSGPLKTQSVHCKLSRCLGRVIFQEAGCLLYSSSVFRSSRSCSRGRAFTTSTMSSNWMSNAVRMKTCIEDTKDGWGPLRSMLLKSLKMFRGFLRYCNGVGEKSLKERKRCLRARESHAWQTRDRTRSVCVSPRQLSMTRSHNS